MNPGICPNCYVVYFLPTPFCKACGTGVLPSAMTRFPTQILVTDKKQPVTINQEDNGDLFCTLCSANWCDHIEYAFLKDLDAEPFWRDLNGEQIELKVPCIPSAGVYQMVRLDYMPALPCYRVFAIGAPGSPEKFLGLLNPGECRRVMRMMIFEFYRGDRNDKDECVANSHSVKAQYQWEKALKKGGAAETATRWSVFLTGHCLFCNETDNVDWDDLVPDDPKPASRW